MSRNRFKVVEIHGHLWVTRVPTGELGSNWEVVCRRMRRMLKVRIDQMIEQRSHFLPGRHTERSVPVNGYLG